MAGFARLVSVTAATLVVVLGLAGPAAAEVLYSGTLTWKSVSGNHTSTDSTTTTRDTKFTFTDAKAGEYTAGSYEWSEETDGGGSCITNHSSAGNSGAIQLAFEGYGSGPGQNFGYLAVTGGEKPTTYNGSTTWSCEDPPRTETSTYVNPAGPPYDIHTPQQEIPFPTPPGHHKGSNTVQESNENSSITTTVSWDITVRPARDPTCVGPFADLPVIGGTGLFDVLSGTDAAEQVLGLDGDDRLAGGGGDDCVRGGDDFDSVMGDGGNDDVDGADHRDRVHGGAGGDLVTGGPDHDAVIGGEGRDTLRGGPGNDLLIDGAGRNKFFGGPGYDWILARQSVVETIDCGPGEDMVFADDRDKLRNCERRMTTEPDPELETGPRTKPWRSGEFTAYDKDDMLGEVDAFGDEIEENMGRCEVQNALFGRRIKEARKTIKKSGFKRMAAALRDYVAALDIRDEKRRKKAIDQARKKFKSAKLLDVGKLRAFVISMAIQQTYERIAFGNPDMPCSITQKGAEAMSFLTSAYADPTVRFMRIRAAWEPRANRLARDGCAIVRHFRAVRDGGVVPPGGVTGYKHEIEVPGGCPR